MTTFDLPDSLWRAVTPPYKSATPPLQGETCADLAIIGGGFTGLSTALAAAKRGANVVLLEAGEIGHGASGRNNGQVIPCLSRGDPHLIVAAHGAEKGEALIDLIRDSASTVFELIRRYKIDCAAVQNGWVQPAHTPGRANGITRQRAQVWSQRGAPAELLDAEETAQLTGSRFWHGAWRNRTGGHVNPLALAMGIAQAAEASGAKLFTQCAVKSITGGASSGYRLETAHGAVLCTKVVVATNAYGGFETEPLHSAMQASWVPVRSYQMCTHPLDPALRQSIIPSNYAVSDTQGDLHFFRWHEDAQGNHRLVTGGALVLHHNYRARLQARIGARLFKVFPQLGSPPQFEHVWFGNLSGTQDGLPHIHQLSDSMFAWVGCNGRGVALATALGPVLAAAALGEDLAALPVPLTPVRRIVAHRVARRVARLALLQYRWRDARG